MQSGRGPWVHAGFRVRFERQAVPAAAYTVGAARGSYPALCSSSGTGAGAPGCLAPPSTALAGGEIRRQEPIDLSSAQPGLETWQSLRGGRYRLGDS